MKLRSFRYYAAEAFRNIIRNRLMSVASIFTVASCIFIVSVFYCLAANVNFFLTRLEGSIEVVAVVRDELTTGDIEVLNEKITAIPHVLTAVYKSKQDALNEMIARLPEEERGWADGLAEDNPLPRKFTITIDDLAYQTDVVNALTELEPFGVSRVNHMQETSNIILGISNMARVVCLALIVILAAVSTVIITNTIRITVNARRGEINIMKYVGATDWFIRWPFVIEGILIGLMGGVIPAALCVFGYARVTGMIKNALPILGDFEFMAGFDIFAYLTPFSIALGILIGVLGSFFSIRKHLKV